MYFVFNNETGVLVTACFHEEPILEYIESNSIDMGLNTLVFKDGLTQDVRDGINGHLLDYDLASDTFSPNLEAYGVAVRNERNEFFEEINAIVTNPLRWNSMTAEQQQEWADYRQALLDVPQQEGFPFDVVWPTKPST